MTASSPISQTVLDSLWDFADPAASAGRFRSAAADGALHEDAAAVLATQVARALGLQGRFDEGHAVLDEVARASDRPSAQPSDGPADRPSTRPSAHVLARVALERGRLHRSAGQAEESVPFFTLAAREAASAGAQFLALDALHMLALSDAGHEEEWAAEGILVLAKAADDRTRRWGVSLHNNLGWHLHDSGRPAEALTEFEAALAAATAVGTDEQRFIGRWAIARCLRTLGRTDEARAIQHELTAERPDDEFVRAELAELTPVSGAQPTIES